jgi:hypothetical protein
MQGNLARISPMVYDRTSEGQIPEPGGLRYISCSRGRKRSVLKVFRLLCQG